ncbi:MAG: TOBE domain-containing protein, partial [Sphingomicrobium sp.]
VQQVGPPMEIYSRPANRFVARFVGSPAMTLAPARLLPGDGVARVQLGDGSVIETRIARTGLPGDGALELGLRPESVRVARTGAGDTQGIVELVERLGERTLIYARLKDGTPITAEDIGTSALRIGDAVGLTIDGTAAHLFGPDGAGFHATTAP